MSRRPERLAEVIKEEVSAMLRGELKDPRIGFATITGVEVSSDLRHAKIYVSVYGSAEEQKSTLEALQAARGYVKGELGRRLRLRYAPEVVFKLDPSLERGARIMELLQEVRERGASES